MFEVHRLKLTINTLPESANFLHLNLITFQQFILC